MVTKSWFTRALMLALALVTIACGGEDRRGPGNTTTDGTGDETDGPQKLNPDEVEFGDTDTEVDKPVTGPGVCEMMDILFVIDDSGSMAPAQTSLKANFPRFMNALSEFEAAQGTELDYRVGVTTTSVTWSQSIDSGLGIAIPLDGWDGLDGKLRDGCDLDRSYVTRDLADVPGSFSCLASVGTTGSGLEMPAQAMLLATSEPSNTSFFREEALLAVVMLTDEDDCSRREREMVLSESDAASISDPDAFFCGKDKILSPSDIVTQLDAFKGDRSRWALSVIGWHPNDNSCEGKLHEQSKPAENLLSLVDESGENAIFSSICDDDLSGALVDAMNNFNFACESFLR